MEEREGRDDVNNSLICKIFKKKTLNVKRKKCSPVCTGTITNPNPLQKEAVAIEIRGWESSG